MLKYLSVAGWLITLGGCAAAAAPPMSETAWPLAIEAPAGKIEVYQPQPESLKGDRLNARAAVSLQTPGSQDPVFGAVWMSARISTDRDERTITIREVDVQDVRFPDASSAQENVRRQREQQEFARVLKEQLPRLNVTFALDELMTSLDVAQREKVEAGQLQTAPPHIIFSTEPATLITIDGAPKLQQLEQPSVKRVVNTPFILLRDRDSSRYFLKTGDSWASAGDVSGPWEGSVTPPPIIAAAAASLAAPAQANTPAAPGEAAQSIPSAAPPAQPVAPGRIIVATEPSELIVTDGQPAYAPISSGDLLYVRNTRSDLFLDVPSQQTYVLLSGRWFRSKSMQGPWENVPSDKLPVAFASIPPDSVKADVLSFVAGTTEAKEAVLDASIPQTASIRRDAGAALKVSYDGEPTFQPIPGTSLTYATNSPDPVVLLGGTYYCCHDGVWHQAPSANGPWSVCVAVPDEIYQIPPSSPVYNCTYVRIYDHDATSVLCGYLPGYTGCYVYGPTIVYGTGYAYPGWYGTYYIPGPRTYGFGCYYDMWSGTWDFGFGYAWGPLWIAHDHFHHGWWGPEGFRHHWHDWHGWDGAHFDHLHDFRGDRINIYHRAPNLNRNHEMAAAEHRFDVRAEGRRNNVFAGHDGQVYRSTERGWERQNNRGWSRIGAVPEAPAPQRLSVHGAPAQRAPAAPRGGGLEAERFARERGASRANGFRGGAGGFRSGGGFHAASGGTRR